jgi:hypothetical protein
MATKAKTFRQWLESSGGCWQKRKYKGLTFDRAYTLFARNFGKDAPWLFGRLGLSIPDCVCDVPGVTCWVNYTPVDVCRRFPKRVFRAALRKVGVRVPAPRKTVTKGKPGAKRQRSDTASRVGTRG